MYSMNFGDPNNIHDITGKLHGNESNESNELNAETKKAISEAYEALFKVLTGDKGIHDYQLDNDYKELKHNLSIR